MVRLVIPTVILVSLSMSESGATLIEYDLAEDLIAAVLSGEVDAAPVDREFTLESMAAHEGNLAIVGPDVPLDSDVGIGV